MWKDKRDSIGIWGTFVHKVESQEAMWFLCINRGRELRQLGVDICFNFTPIESGFPVFYKFLDALSRRAVAPLRASRKLEVLGEPSEIQTRLKINKDIVMD